MQTSIDFREIPVFADFSPEARQTLAGVFGRRVCRQHELVVSMEEPVPGIFIIVEGEVHVKLPHLAQAVATLSRGQCFGEMSLLDNTKKNASANVVVASTEAKLLYCAMADFTAILHTFPESASAFYRGVAIQLASRLRQLNIRIDQVIDDSIGHVSKHMESAGVESKIIETKSALDRTGEKVIGNLMEVIPEMEALLQDFPLAKSHVDKLREKVERVFLVDAQDFDRIAQQLNQIQQHVSNLRSLVNGGSIDPIKGDQTLFKQNR